MGAIRYGCRGGVSSVRVDAGYRVCVSADKQGVAQAGAAQTQTGGKKWKKKKKEEPTINKPRRLSDINFLLNFYIKKSPLKKGGKGGGNNRKKRVL